MLVLYRFKTSSHATELSRGTAMPGYMTSIDGTAQYLTVISCSVYYIERAHQTRLLSQTGSDAWGYFIICCDVPSWTTKKKRQSDVATVNWRPTTQSCLRLSLMPQQSEFNVMSRTQSNFQPLWQMIADGQRLSSIVGLIHSWDIPYSSSHN